MSLTPKDIKALARLARLGVDKSELELFANDVNRIVDWVSILKAAPTQGLAPLATPNEEPCTLRPDVVETSSSERRFNNAQRYQDGFFLVPQVI